MGFSQTIKKDRIWLKPILIFNIVILQLKQEGIHFRYRPTAVCQVQAKRRRSGVYRGNDKGDVDSMNWIGL